MTICLSEPELALCVFNAHLSASGNDYSLCIRHCARNFILVSKLGTDFFSK